MRFSNVAPKHTFVPPLLDGSLTLPEIYDHHYHHSAGHPLFTFAQPDGTVRTLTWSNVVLAVHHGQRLLENVIPQKRGGVVVAILASIDTPTYWTLMMAIMRSGNVPFPISTRNSDVGVAHLLATTQTEYVLVSEDAAMQSTFDSAYAILAADNGTLPTKLPVFAFDELYLPGAHPLPPLSRADPHTTALILHSSGSTSFPKPIRISHRELFGWTQAPSYGGIDLCGHALSIHNLPMFHAMGTQQICWTAVTGMISAVFSPHALPAVATPDLVLDAAILTKSSLIFCIPAFIEHWFRDPRRLPTLQGFQALVFAGAPLDQDIGDTLVKQGVSLIPAYGLTETGPLTRIFPSAPPKEGWQYFQIAPNCDPVFLPYADTTDVFQLVLVQCPTHAICLLNTEVDGRQAYDTNDLLVRHPTRHDLWKVFGRADDQIMHSSGEKTNPVPIETIISKHELVSAVLVFGRSRFHAGLLVEPAIGHDFDLSNPVLLAEFRNKIWPSVEEANHVAPSHSRIFKEMILVASRGKPFQYTPKRTPRRNVCLDAYEAEIENIYKASEASVHDVVVPASWDYASSLVFARALVASTMSPVTVGDTADLFNKGCDSLQATRIRNTILHGLRTSSRVDVRHLPHGIIYENSTIERLAAFITGTVDDEKPLSLSPIGDASAKVAEMEDLLALYTQDLPVFLPSSDCNKPEGDVVLLTGSTGALGSYILEELLKDPSVLRVYALNRKAVGGSLVERQVASFEEKGIATSLVTSPKLVLLAGDTSKEGLGLEPELFEILQTELTNIIHNAWRLDFNVSLSSMAPLLTGTRRLVDLALSSTRDYPPKFMFTSSIGVLRNWNSPEPAPPMRVPAAIAVSNGYGESKWVAEALILKAAELNPSFKPTVVRVGQLSGGSNGSWNTAEWLPSIVKSAQAVGCLPLAEGIVSWVPCDVAALSLVASRNDGQQFMNLCHPNPVSWTSVFEHFSAGLDVPLVSYSEWIDALEESSTTSETAAVDNPALLLLEFFKASDVPLPNKECEALGFPRLATQAAEGTSLSKLRVIGAGDVERWLAYWRRIGFLN